MTHPKIYATLFGTILTIVLLFFNSTNFAISESANMDLNQNKKVFELRTYTTYDGKLDDLHQRFANHTMDIFEKHGMKNIGYWIPVDQENTLIYIISHESRDVASENWEAFGADAEWRKAFAESREDGPIVEKVESVFMTRTEYSPLK